MLKEGDKAPDFSLPASEKETVRLSDFRGKKNVVLYFYPKDNTPGCTVEACDFRDNMARLAQADTQVLGVSRDTLKSHAKFAQQHELPFPLLSDPEGEVCELYGCWKEKSMYGKKYFGIERSTFLIDKKGIIRRVWRNVSVKGHVDEVLEALQAID